jgi:hypothetical protein
MIRCENCGYGNQDSAQRCVKCNALLDRQPASGADMSKATRQVTPNDNPAWDPTTSLPLPPPPKQPADDSGKTQRFNFKQPGAGSFVLVALSEDGTKEERIIDLKGGEIILNREILDKDNLSLARGGQARLTQQDGKWRIENMSSLGSTFLQISSPTEIQEGDVLLMGDTLFRFKRKS